MTRIARVGWGRTGPGSWAGSSAGTGVDFTYGGGRFCEGDSVSAGMFAEGGTGTFSSGSVDVGGDDASATIGVSFGIGGGWSFRLPTMYEQALVLQVRLS